MFVHILHFLWFKTISVLFCLWIIVIYCRIESTSSPHTSSWPLSTRTVKLRPPSGTVKSRSCGFSGNSDLYGIGIRLGYYTQAISLWAANFFVLGEVRKLRSVNTLFLLALFIGLAWLSRDPSQTYAVEAFLLLQLVFTTAFVGSLNRSRFSAKFWEFNATRMIIQDAYYLGLIAYNLWFWWVGLDLFMKTPCGTYIFFTCFKLDLFGWYRSMHMVFSAIAVCYHPLVTLGHLAQSFQHFHSRHLRSVVFFRKVRQNLEPTAHQCAPRGLCVTAWQTQTTEKQAKFRLCRLDTPEHHHTLRDLASRNIDSLVPPRSSLELISSSRVWQESWEYSEFPQQPALPIPSSQYGSSHDETLLPPLPPSPIQNISSSAHADHAVSPATQESHSIEHMPPPPSFADLLGADMYIDCVFNAINAAHIVRKVRVRYTPMTFMVPSLTVPRTFFNLSRKQDGVEKRLGRVDRCKLRSGIMILLLMHVYSFRKYPFYLYPTIAYLALLCPTHESLSPETLTTVMALRALRLPERAPQARANQLLYMLGTLANCVGLILSIELSIRWNHIGGMASFGVVGQLIPAIIGVGGLLNVLWAWTHKRRRTLDEGAESDAVQELRECGKVYERLREGLVHVKQARKPDIV